MRPGIFFVGHPVSKSWAAAAVAKELGIIELGANMCVWIYVCVCVRVPKHSISRALYDIA